MACGRCCPGNLLLPKFHQSPVWRQLCCRWPPVPSHKQCKQPHPGSATTTGCWSHSQPGTSSLSGRPTPSRGTYQRGRAGDLNPTSKSGTCYSSHRWRHSSLQWPLHSDTFLYLSAGWWKHRRLWWWRRCKKHHSLKTNERLDPDI